jgi:phosphonate transport system substrate-binding protein
MAGGVTTVQVIRKSGGRVQPIVIREKDREFKSYVIAHASLRARSLEDLRGKSFAFGSRSSTSGHVMPRFYMLRAGIVPEKAFASVTYTGDHKKTVQAVEGSCGRARRRQRGRSPLSSAFSTSSS